MKRKRTMKIKGATNTNKNKKEQEKRHPFWKPATKLEPIRRGKPCRLTASTAWGNRKNYSKHCLGNNVDHETVMMTNRRNSSYTPTHVPHVHASTSMNNTQAAVPVAVPFIIALSSACSSAFYHRP